MQKKKRILVIVAHPDDETIWCGGTLLRTKFDKTIICLCRKNDKDRAPRFEKACKILGARGYISDLDDSEEGDYKKITNEDILSRIKQFIEGEYNYLFTHGENGEYGHVRHIQINKAVNETLNKKLLSAKKVFFFSYVKKNEFCDISPDANKFIYLNNLVFLNKKNLIQNIYGFKKNSFEERCCKNTEAFDIKK